MIMKIIGNLEQKQPKIWENSVRLKNISKPLRRICNPARSYYKDLQSVTIIKSQQYNNKQMKYEKASDYKS